MNQETAAQPAAEPRRSPFPRRLVPKLLVSCLLLATLVNLLLITLGAAEIRSLFYIGVAALLVLGSSVAWEVVERRRTEGGFLAWLAFPISWLLAFGQIPFLALAVYPPLEKDLLAEGRVEAYIVRRGTGLHLELWFPIPMETMSRGNLRFNSTPLLPEYREKHRESFRWIGAQTLSIALEPLARDLDLGDIRTVSVNMEITSRPFHYENGSRVPGQKVRVRGE